MESPLLDATSEMGGGFGGDIRSANGCRRSCNGRLRCRSNRGTRGREG
jgi:hypothetical protein